MALITEPWPLCRANQIHVKNPEHPVAILTCWTKKKNIIKMLDEAGVEYNSVGQLYTERGYSPLIRNLLANRHIRMIMLCGRDLSGAGDKLISLFHNRDTETLMKIKNTEDIQTVSKSELIHYVAIQKIEEEGLIEELESATRLFKNKVLGKAIYIPEPKIEVAQFPAEKFGHAVTGRSIPEVYLKMLQYILRFGHETDTHYDDPQKEVLAMQNIITDSLQVWDFENNKLLSEVPSWMPEDKQHLEDYIKNRMLSGQKWEELKYTYGNLIFAFPDLIHGYAHGAEPVSKEITLDQFDKALMKMYEDMNQRSCVISLWNPLVHTGMKSGTPCLNHLQFRIVNGMLMLHALIRSNDMFAGWPENAYALRAIQEFFQYELHKAEKFVELGPLCITSISAHLYKDTWEAAQQLVDEHLWECSELPWKDWDTKGQFEVEVENGEIVVTLSRNDRVLQHWKGTSARKISNEISKSIVTNHTSNLLYLGRELQKAEIKLSKPMEGGKV